MNDKKKILLTGATGFVGSSVIDELQKAGRYEICGISGSRKRVENAEPLPTVKFLTADISDYRTLANREELKKANVIIHAAGLAHRFGRVSREDFWRVNVRGTENVCRLASETGAGHFILISTVAVYGDHGDAEIDETYICKPNGFYAESKFESEIRAREICERDKIRLTIVRPATVVGEGDRGNISRLIRALDKGRFIWIGEGNNKKSLIYKNDVAGGILRIVEAGAVEDKIEIYNLTGEAVSVRKCVETISGTLKKNPRLKISERWVREIFSVSKKGFSAGYLKKLERTFEKWLSDDIFSGRKFFEAYKFKPKTSISEALEKQVNYYLENKNKK